MARSPYQKLKPLYIMNYLLQNSDEEHPVTMKQIVEHLDAQGIRAERKSVYDDLEALRVFGLDIVHVEAGRFQGYFVAQRNFELPELKLLVDSVQSSKFITHKKTATLIRKIEKLASIHEAQLLQRQVYVKNRIKTMNESIYFNVDEIHNGISQNKKIQFKYFEYTIEKTRHFRKDGAFYVVSPYALTWDDENYYMVAFDSEAGIIKHYRVDKMTEISTIEQARDGKEAFESLDMAMYARKVFGMFSGEEVRVKLRFENHLVGAVLDRLGREVMIVRDGDAHFTVSADVVVSPQFFAWVTGFGAAAEIVGPDKVVAEMAAHIRSVAKLYESVDQEVDK